MPCSLLGLPAELYRMIIEDLLRHKKTKKHHELVNIDHLINWSCTCSYLRNLLAPEIFKAAILVNDEKSGSSLSAVAKSPHNVHLKDLHFIGSAPGSCYSADPAYSDTEGILPRSVDALLCNLQWFPSLRRLSIGFDDKRFLAFLDSVDRDDDGSDISIESETQRVFEFEASAARRALMSRTLDALTKNKPPNFKHLEFRQLTSNVVSTFSDSAFHECLHHLEQFTLSIYGEEPEEHQSNVVDEYHSVMEQLNEYVFNHLTNVTILSIKSPKEKPLDLAGMQRHVPLALKANQIPLLVTLRLNCMFASAKLIDFLVGHKTTLEELILRNCYASTDSFLGPVVRWSQFLTSLFSANPTQLRRLELVGCEWLFGTIHTPREEYDKIWTIYRQDPKRRMFHYANLYDNFTYLLYDEKESLASLLDGEDQRCWDRLVDLVERNVKEAAKRKEKSFQLQAQ